MVKIIKYLFFFVSLFVLFNACVTDLDIELSEQSSVVLNGIIVPENEIEITLYRSQQKNDTIGFANINNAEVILFVNQVETETLSFIGNGKYQSKQVAKEQTSYRITVETEDGETVWAETTTPALNFGATIYNLNELDSLKPTSPYFLEINSNMNKVENCWLASYHTKNDYDTLGNAIIVEAMSLYLYSDSPYADRFNSTYDPDGYYCKYDYSLFIHAYTNNLTDENLLIEFSTGGAGGLIGESIIVFNTDDHYSNYLKSKIINEEGAGYLTNDGPPINYTPTFLYSNVHGGVGILGSYTTYTKTYIYD